MLHKGSTIIWETRYFPTTQVNREVFSNLNHNTYLPTTSIAVRSGGDLHLKHACKYCMLTFSAKIVRGVAGNYGFVSRVLSVAGCGNARYDLIDAHSHAGEDGEFRAPLL